jgi:hypothetical protein
MRDDIDRLIDEALGAEESELLRRAGGDPTIIEQAFGLFGAGAGWTAALLMVVQSLLFITGAGTGWRFFQAADPVAQLRWGLPSAVLLLAALTIKLSVGPTLQADRLMRELKRIELQIARRG